MTRLRVLGYAVEATSGPHGGYRLEAGGALPPLLLDDEEAVTVALALRVAAEGGLAGFEDSALAALAKIQHVLPPGLQARIGEVADSTVRWARGSGSTAPIDIAALVVIARACKGQERLRFTYRDAHDRVTDRHVEPFQLVHVSRRWYLVARDRDRDAWRSFRVDRLSGPAPTGMRFTLADPPDPLAFVTEGIAVGVYRYRAKVRLSVPLDEARRLVGPTIGILEPVGAETDLIIGADELGWIAGYLAGMPCRFTVIEPAALEDAIAGLAARLAEQVGDRSM